MTEDYLAQPLKVALLVVEVFEALTVPYFIGGSFASAWHGIARATLDSDIVADLHPEHVEAFVQALEDVFYLDKTAVREAVERSGSFNLIHLDTMFKVDVFVAKQRPFDRAQLQNATEQIVAEDPIRTAYIASAEDTILAKLEWYRLGGEVSERQWRDVLGVASLQYESLDWRYMTDHAVTLHVSDLLERLKNAVHADNG